MVLVCGVVTRWQHKMGYASTVTRWLHSDIINSLCVKKWWDFGKESYGNICVPGKKK